MEINGIAASIPAPDEAPSPSAFGADNGLDRNAFLRLLLTQLANQDPLEPIKDQAFVAQLAQFSSLERLEEIADSVDTLVSLSEPGTDEAAEPHQPQLESTEG